MPPTKPSQRVEEVVTRDAELVLTREEHDAILEVAYLAVAADHALRDEELAAFRALASRLRERIGDPAQGAPATPAAGRDIGRAELDGILDKYAAGVDRKDADVRLRELAPALTRREARRGAYKLAYALALRDLDVSDAEFEFDLQLIDSLGLAQEEAEELASEVISVFNGDE